LTKIGVPCGELNRREGNKRPRIAGVGSFQRGGVPSCKPDEGGGKNSTNFGLNRKLKLFQGEGGGKSQKANHRISSHRLSEGNLGNERIQQRGREKAVKADPGPPKKEGSVRKADGKSHPKKKGGETATGAKKGKMDGVKQDENSGWKKDWEHGTATRGAPESPFQTKPCEPRKDEIKKIWGTASLGTKKGPSIPKKKGGGRDGNFVQRFAIGKKNLRGATRGKNAGAREA